MSFRLLGVPVYVEPWFWLTALLLGRNIAMKGDFRRLLVWVAIVFVSVLVHEFGHVLAVKAHRIDPEVRLHWIGGHTTWETHRPLGRLSHLLISLAGPAAGLLLAGGLYLLSRVPAVLLLPDIALFGLEMMLYVNLWWSLFNLIPVLPLDGGHVLEHVLGPSRARLTAAISFLVAGGLTLWFALQMEPWMALLFAMSAMQSFQRFGAEPEVTPAMERRRATFQGEEDELPMEVVALLRRARRAIEDEQTAEAATLAREVLDFSPAPPRRALREATEVLGWAKLLDGEPQAAAEAVAQARKLEEPDPALVGAVHIALGELRQARRVLEAAREAGDDRKEVAGPLIRVLIEQGEIERAAALAFEIVDLLSEEDARKVAALSFEHGAFDGSARLYEAIFRRNGLGEDAYGAARANAKGGNIERALELLQRAVDAGFSDRARAWSDTALESLKNGPLETVLPRP